VRKDALKWMRTFFSPAVKKKMKQKYTNSGKTRKKYASEDVYKFMWRVSSSFVTIYTMWYAL
tara:strand:- start:700 stop:885 length:186 start_codon:yes stop_codon:yes gene_type:complete